MKPWIIKVNRNVLFRNRKTGRRDPPLTATSRLGSQYGDEMVIHDRAGNAILRVLYRPATPTKRGAQIWMTALPGAHVVDVHRSDGPTVSMSPQEGFEPIIHVVRQAIDENRTNGTMQATINIAWGDEEYDAERIRFYDARGEIAAEVIYDAENSLPCGAHVWVEADAKSLVLIKNRGDEIAMPGGAVKKGLRYEEWLAAEGMAGFETGANLRLEVFG